MKKSLIFARLHRFIEGATIVDGALIAGQAECSERSCLQSCLAANVGMTAGSLSICVSVNARDKKERDPKFGVELEQLRITESFDNTASHLYGVSSRVTLRIDYAR